MKRTSKKERRTAWLGQDVRRYGAKMTDLLVSMGGHRGKVDWNLATLHFLNDKSPSHAAERQLNQQKEQGLI